MLSCTIKRMRWSAQIPLMKKSVGGKIREDKGRKREKFVLVAKKRAFEEKLT